MMAYMNFAAYRDATALEPVFPPARAHAGEASELSQRDWTIVRLARADGLNSLYPEGRWGRLFRRIFGIERKNPLSDERLEALRRVAVLSWHHGYNVPPSEIGGLLAAGFSELQYERLARHVVAERAARRGRMA